MTLLQLVQASDDGLTVPAVESTDWPDMPIRSVVMGTHYVQIMEEDLPDAPPFHRDFYFANLLQMVRWKLNLLMWRNRWTELDATQEQETENLLAQCARFHVDVLGFISTLGAPPAACSRHTPMLSRAYSSKTRR